MGTRSSFLWTKPSLLVLPPPSICHDRYVSATAFSHSGSAHQTRRQEYEKRRKEKNKSCTQKNVPERQHGNSALQATFTDCRAQAPFEICAGILYHHSQCAH